jgi:26S proteasome regulatory subunit N3
VQATVLNVLVRGYLQDNLVEQAHLLLTKATFPATAPTSEAARHHYYLGADARVRK